MRLRDTAILATFGYLITVVLAPPLHAADDAGTPPSEVSGRRAQLDPSSTALQLFEQSAAAYNEGRFQDAIDLLLEARRAKEEPVLLYNLGRAYEAMGRPAEAADAYAGYLAEAPAAPDRRAIDGRIATLRAQAALIERAKHPASPAAPTTSTADTPAKSQPSIAPWVITGVGLGGLAVGTTFGLLSNARHDAAERDPTQQTAKEKLDESMTFATAANVGLIVGGVASLVGLAWLGFRGLRNAGTSPHVTWTSGPGFGMRGTF